MPASTSVAKVAPLKRLQTKLRGHIELFKTIAVYADTIRDVTSVQQIAVRVEKLDELWEKVNETIEDIENHDDYNPDTSDVNEERVTFVNMYYNLKGVFMEKIKELEESSASHQSTRFMDSSLLPTVEHVKLPQIKLQSFSGDIDEWLSFRDLFLSLIHTKADLPNVEKFHYLKGCLSGEAKALVDPLSITAVNYQVAWDILMKRYNDSKILKRRQVRALFSLPNVPRESPSQLQTLLEGFERSVQTLDQLVKAEDYKDLLLLEILGSRLDPSTRRAWEEVSANKEKDKIKDLTEFLQTRVKVLSCLSSNNADARRDQPQWIRKQPTNRTANNASQFTTGRCIACPEDHLLHQCLAFKNLSVAERKQLIRKHSMCRNCFRRGHIAMKCPSTYVCRSCRGKHHTLLCFHAENRVAHSAVTETSMGQRGAERAEYVGESSSTGTTSANTARRSNLTMLLATAVVLVEDCTGFSYPARALLDSGSECNFMTETLCQRLGVQRKSINISVVGIGQANSHVKHQVSALIRSRTSSFSRKMDFLVLPKVTADLPTATVDTSNWKLPPGVNLADPSYCKSKSIDLVLGIQDFFEFFQTGNKIRLGEGLPTLTESIFGWVVSGVVDNWQNSSQTVCNTAVSQDLDEILTRFWICEELEPLQNYSPNESRCEEQFVRTVRRGSDGRYTVSLPKDEDVFPSIGDSRDIAYRRLQSLERRLAREPEMRQQYTQFLADYLKLGHMRKIDETLDAGRVRCYLPHHPVIKESSTTTKLRVVFDASCSTSSGKSLNDILLAGPVIQDDLRSTILRSRTKQFMIVADVEKMFRQIHISDADKPLQSILWREDPTEEVKTYELTTVTYGTKPAPFLATRVLKQLAMDEELRFPKAAKVLIEDVYMDDVLTGTDDELEGVLLSRELRRITECGGFNLRKFASNSRQVLEDLPDEYLALTAGEEIDLDPDPSVKTLGLVWQPRTDTFRFQFIIKSIGVKEPQTKRKVLSVIATLFDPLGLIGAVITTAKIMMQQLWCIEDENGKKLDWDLPIPRSIDETWRSFYSQLHQLNDLRIPRCTLISNAVERELHVFSDASERAYGACAYLRSSDQYGNFIVRLLTSKSRVSPLKTQSIPRLELCGALKAAELAENIQSAFKFQISLHFWTDSTCVLQWLKHIPSTWSTYVANRVSRIQKVTERHPWRHVPGDQNPADLISRGITPDQIRDDKLWWEGPEWLQLDEGCWPRQTERSSDEHVKKEARKTAAHNVIKYDEAFGYYYCKKFSSFIKLIRATAYWIRLKGSLCKNKVVSKGHLSTKELKEAEFAVIRCIQQEAFRDEWKALSKGTELPRTSALKWYNPKIGLDNLIRLGGRLANSNETVDVKHPIVLPARHPFTRLLLEHYHLKMLHAAPQLLLATIRLQYWPLGGRSIVRQVVHNCLRCYRQKPKTVEQFMGELPAARVTVSPPFSKAGVDYFGPIYVCPGPRRPAVKAYGALFVCLCTKAIHLELVTDMSTEKFIQALERFIGRRSIPTDLYSDNGTNFVGARNQMKHLLEKLHSKDYHREIVGKCAEQGIQWHFNPPAAPHFGGLWEAAVKSAKRHLMKVMGENAASYEDLNTLFIKIEACLNSRPLTPLSEDPNDLAPLTPGHFLVGRPLLQLPEHDWTEAPTNRLNNFQLNQQRLQHFWTRWRKEYLSQLQGRTKRWKQAVPIKVGQLVVIRDENLPPLRWRTGRITDVHPGTDGVVRVVTLKTANGTTTRAVEKICLLPPRLQPVVDESGI
ncbi:uncharacterized protein LOC129743026 [Uranotaenia lowii]|uniref:uncharacterized protein LOC129743026 n=1 Tax=Uranotaenia lowii TaxID=190385 RepID=UPI002479BEDE|nr:uncharacterized protein LOC129743026 [Uranotaenia lowii]